MVRGLWVVVCGLWVLVCGLRFCGLWLFFHVLFVSYGLLFADLLFGGHGLWFKAWCCCRRSSFSFAKEKTKLSCDCVAITRRCAAARATWGGGRGWGGLKETVGCRVWGGGGGGCVGWGLGFAARGIGGHAANTGCKQEATQATAQARTWQQKQGQHVTCTTQGGAYTTGTHSS